jgi:lipopolysaccharide transport system ATP-binding protein
MSVVIRVEDVSKQYRLGQVGTGTLSADLTRMWARIRGKEDPFLKIGQTNDRTKKATRSESEPKSGLLSRISPLAARDSSDLVWALKDINFEVKEGEVLGIIGRNGAGKSTLLKLLARVTQPTTGQIKVRGRIASLLEVGTGFHPDLTGQENIFLNGAILGMRKHEINRKLDEIIDFSGCERYINTPVKRYSSGMYVRLAFAVAAHLEPEILIVDEVLAVGDAEFQKKCLGKMQDVAKRGRTVIFVSHNMAAVASLCPTCCLISNGNVDFFGPVSSAVSLYLKAGEDSSRANFASQESSVFSFRSILSKRQTGETTSVFEHHETIEIQIEYQQNELVRGLEIGLVVYSQQGFKVFTTERSHSDKSDILIGRYFFRISIPGGLLAPGNYTIGIAAHVPNQQILQVIESAMGFRIEETGSLLSMYHGSISGVIICRCNWETITIDSAEHSK